MTSQPCAQKRPPKTPHKFGQLTCTRRQMGRCQVVQVRRFASTTRSGRRQVPSLPPAHVGTVRVNLQSIDWGQCTSASVQEQVNWFSLTQTRSYSGMQPFQQAAAEPRVAVTGRTTFAFLSQSAHAPSCLRSGAHIKEERRGLMERSQMTCPWLCAFEPKAVVVFNVLHVWAFSWGWLVVLAPSSCHSGT